MGAEDPKSSIIVSLGQMIQYVLSFVAKDEVPVLTDRLIDLTASPQVKMGENWHLPFSDKMLRKLQSRKSNGWTTVLKTNI